MNDNHPDNLHMEIRQLKRGQRRLKISMWILGLVLAFLISRTPRGEVFLLVLMWGGFLAFSAWVLFADYARTRASKPRHSPNEF